MKRIPELDAARGFTVLIMPAVHTVMLYGKLSVYSTWLGTVLAFLAEGPGAQLFMFLMGFSIVLAKRKTTGDVVQRSVSLFIIGYVLNVLRLVFPYLLGAFPDPLLQDYTINPKIDNVVFRLTMIGDILQFAGIAFLIISFLNRLKYRFEIATIFFVATIFVSPFLWGAHVTIPLLDYLLALFCDNGHRAFFPVFPWLCYPLAGFIGGLCFNSMSAKQFYINAAKLGIVLMVLGLVVSRLLPASWNGDFYRGGPGQSISQTGFVLLWLCGMKLYIRYFGGFLFTKLLIFCSRHITSIYLVQWILIGWGIGIAGYHTLGLTASILALMIMSALTFGIILLWKEMVDVGLAPRI